MVYDCNVSFLGNCILQVWNYGSALHPCKCPLCRREITLLVPSEVSSRQRHDPGVAEVLQRTERYNHIFGERSNGLMQVYFKSIVFYLSHLNFEPYHPKKLMLFHTNFHSCLFVPLTSVPPHSSWVITFPTRLVSFLSIWVNGAFTFILEFWVLWVLYGWDIFNTAFNLFFNNWCFWIQNLVLLVINRL